MKRSMLKGPHGCLVAAVTATAAFAGGTAILIGIAAVRASYLHRKGINAQYAAFMAVQAGIFIAAVITSYRHSHPYDRDHRRTRTAVGRALARLAQCDLARVALVGLVNATIQRRLNILGAAVEHFLASLADTRRLIQLAARRVQIDQPEPVATPMFPDGLPMPAEPAMLIELREHLSTSGLNTTSTFKRYAPLSTEQVDVRLAALDQRRETLRGIARGVLDRRRAHGSARPGTVTMPGSATTAGGTPASSGTTTPNGSAP